MTEIDGTSSPSAPDDQPPKEGAGSPEAREGRLRAPMRGLDELVDEKAEGGWRHLPATLMRAFVLVWQAGRKEFLITTALHLVSAFGIVAQLFMVQDVFADVLAAAGPGHDGFGSIIPQIGALAGLTVTLQVISVVSGEQSRILGELVARRALDRIMDVATRVDLLSFESSDFYDRLRRAQVTGPHRGLQVANGAIGFVGEIVSSVGIVVALLAIQPLLLPLVLFGYIPLWIVGRLNVLDLYAFGWQMTENDRMRMYLQRVMMDRDPAKEVRSFNLAPVLRKRYDRLYEEKIAELRSMAARRTRRSVIGSLVRSALTALALGGIAFFFVTGRMDLAAASAAIFGLQQLSDRLGGLHHNLMELYEAVMFVRDYDSFVALEPALDAAPSKPPPQSFEHLEIDDVWFTYPGAAAPALAGVSMDVRAGEIVALVGENGSGKTTLAKVLAGLYSPDRGTVRWDEVDVSQVDRDELRRSIAVIFQDFERYRVTARENIGFGRAERAEDSKAVEAAARRAGAHRFIGALPDGYESMLGREWMGGYDLSIGQWQRVALARAFFRDAPFVILDEPTAALDPRAESNLFDRMRELLEGRSVVLISHRFSSVRSADRIYVLENGKVTEHGTHKELMELSGHYAHLFTLQARAYVG